jgi:hypothetical protein
MLFSGLSIGNGFFFVIGLNTFPMEIHCVLVGDINEIAIWIEWERIGIKLLYCENDSRVFQFWYVLRMCNG